ncbi:MAG: GNAT family N-acetyltransferase [Pseudomonadota bacterium]
MMYGKTHLTLDKRDWKKGDLSIEHFDARLKLDDIPATWGNYKGLVKQIATGVEWEDLEAHSEKAVRPLLEQGRIVLLRKDNVPIGYSLITPASTETKRRFNLPENSAEIVNICLFKGYRGDGVGRSFLGMIFKDLYQTNDAVYLGTSDFNADSIVDFYKKNGMSVRSYDTPTAKVA